MTIHLAQTVKSWFLGIEEIHKHYYHDKMLWLPLTDEIRYDDRWEDESLHICDASDIVDNYLQYLPGVGDAFDYGDYNVSFDMNDVAEAGWTELELTTSLQAIADNINQGHRIKMYGYPWIENYKDNWGADRSRWRFQGLRPPLNNAQARFDKPEPFAREMKV